MPVCDGAKLLEMIRSMKELEDLPVVFFTSIQDRKRIVEVLKLNTRIYILKGTSSYKILEYVREFFIKSDETLEETCEVE